MTPGPPRDKNITSAMGIREAHRYINDHRKKQSDPFLWPDFMTGLPDRPAVLKMLDKFYPKLKTFCVAYICIENIQPYLVKYGSKNHVEIIQWAAGILKTTADSFGGFVGILDTHDFIVILKQKDFEGFMARASADFEKKAITFYSDRDLKNGYVLSFSRDGKDVRMGLMGLKYRTTDGMNIPKERIIPELERACTSSR